MFLSNLSLKRPVLVTVAILALLVLGIVGYMELNINDWPKMELPYVSVTVAQPGSSPEQVASNVGEKIEEAVGQISGVKHIYTICNEGVALVWVEFTMETPVEEAALNVRDKIAAMRSEFPEDIEEPVVEIFDPNAIPTVTLALTGDRSLREMTEVAEDLLKPRLQTINGVGDVEIYGAEEREIQIQLDLDKVAAHQLTVFEITESLQSENLDIPAGKLNMQGKQLILRTTGEVDRMKELRKIPVARRDGVQLYVEDIAEVVDGIKDKENIARYQEKPTIGLEIIKKSGCNTVVVADQVKKTVERIKLELPEGVEVNVIRDNSVRIRNNLDGVEKTLVEGGILAVLVIFLFLKNWRSTAIGALAIPTSIISSFFAMRLLGFTLNTMSMLALSISVGLLIDDAIVVIENIYRHLKMGKTPVQAAREGTAEIGLAVTATTMTLVAAFLPVGLAEGFIGEFLKEFGITVAVCVLVSLLVSFTLVPLLSSRYLSNEEFVARRWPATWIKRFNERFDALAEWYSRMLGKALQRRAFTLIIAFGLFVASIMLVPLLGSSLLPTADLGQMNLTVDLDAGLDLEAVGKINRDIEKLIKGDPDVESIYNTVTTSQIKIQVNLRAHQERERDQQSVIKDLRRELQKIPGIQASLLAETGTSQGKPVGLRLLGDNMQELQVYGRKIERVLEDIPGVVDLSSSYRPGKPELNVEIDQKAAADLGISTAQTGLTLNTLFNGTVVSQFNDENDRVDIRLRLGDKDRRDVKDLDRVYLLGQYPETDSNPVPVALGQVSKAVFVTGSSEIQRFDKSREVFISANLDGISSGEFNKIFNEKIKGINLPDGYRIDMGGESEDMANSFASLLIALILGILFIFFILAAQFESYIDPLSILLALPMAVIGAIAGLLVAGSDISVVAMIGIIMLMGLVTKNAILLVDFTKQQRAQGIEKHLALREAGLVRFRPIMMTTLAMIMGMLPVALNLEIGGGFRAPMAHAIIGGLISSTLLTLFVVPVFYSLLDDLGGKFSFTSKT
ncbi:MAG: efflux RND transporter permease subunit [Syntrophomonadaceae bacterium]|nr:efflux RND transporter permease subunit [Syntrophomonadaceae bacterium]